MRLNWIPTRYPQRMPLERRRRATEQLVIGADEDAYSLSSSRKTRDFLQEDSASLIPSISTHFRCAKRPSGTRPGLPLVAFYACAGCTRPVRRYSLRTGSYTRPSNENRCHHRHRHPSRRHQFNLTRSTISLSYPTRHDQPKNAATAYRNSFKRHTRNLEPNWAWCAAGPAFHRA